MNTHIKSRISKLHPCVRIGYSRILFRLFLGVVLFISFSRCGGGEDEPTPTPKLDTPTIKPDNTNPAVKSKKL